MRPRYAAPGSLATCVAVQVSLPLAVVINAGMSRKMTAKCSIRSLTSGHGSIQTQCRLLLPVTPPRLLPPIQFIRPHSVCRILDCPLGINFSYRKDIFVGSSGRFGRPDELLF
jgi:hypothetical protein